MVKSLFLIVSIGLLHPGAGFPHSNAGKFAGAVQEQSDSSHHVAKQTAPSLAFPGKIIADPRQVSNITIRVNGKVIQARSLYPGKFVRKGEVLARLESAELETYQKTYLGIYSNLEAVKAVSTTSEEKLIDGRMGLAWRGLSNSEIKQLEQSGAPLKTIAIRAPVSGFVYALNAINNQILNGGAQSGQSTSSGAIFATIAKPQGVMVEVNLPLGIAARIATGSQMRVHLPGTSGRRVPVLGTIASLNSFANTTSQRRVARIRFNNVPTNAVLAAGLTTHVEIDETQHDHPLSEISAAPVAR